MSGSDCTHIYTRTHIHISNNSNNDVISTLIHPPKSACSLAGGVTFGEEDEGNALRVQDCQRRDKNTGQCAMATDQAGGGGEMRTLRVVLGAPGTGPHSFSSPQNCRQQQTGAANLCFPIAQLTADTRRQCAKPPRGACTSGTRYKGRAHTTFKDAPCFAATLSSSTRKET